MQGGSGTRPSPSAAAAAMEDRAFDIAESLRGSDGDRASGVGPGGGAPTDQVDVEEVFEKFKAGVAEQIDVDDAQSHYDLGVAYKEMGLVDDALREFEVAARDVKRVCVCQSMIGMIHIERGNLNEAIDAFMRGLQSPERTRDQEAALSYEIGAAFEVKRMNKQALDYFQRTARLTPVVSRHAGADPATPEGRAEAARPRRRRGRRRRVRPRLRRHPRPRKELERSTLVLAGGLARRGDREEKRGGAR